MDLNIKAVFPGKYIQGQGVLIEHKILKNKV